ncbi:MAG: hypothetical protein AB7V58_00425 [Solirubrobacterales bacterium]
MSWRRPTIAKRYLALSLAGLAALALAAAGCGGGGSSTTGAATTGTSTKAGGAAATGEPAASTEAGGAELEQRVGWESYWYSLYNLSALSMGKSGMGIRFMPPKAKVMAVLKEAGLKEPPLANPYFVSVPYSSGDPHFTQPWKPEDGATWRWAPSSFDTTITPQAYAWTAVKYTEWAKNFENHAKTNVDPSALNHFRGIMLNNLAATATGWMQENMALPSGLFAAAWEDGKVTDSKPKLGDQLAVLVALGSLETVADPGNGFAWYKAPLPAAKVRMMEDGLFTALSGSSLVSNPSFADLALGVQALSWYAFTTEDPSLKKQATALALEWAKQLRGKLGQDGSVSAAGVEPLDAQALAVRAEGQAALLAGAFDKGEEAAARGAAEDAWRNLNDRYWNDDPGLYEPDPGGASQAYTPALLADLTGALNVAQNVLDDGEAADRYAQLFVNVVDEGHLIASQLPETVEQHNGLPLPPKAGGKYGIAPVFQAEVSFDADSGKWSVSDGSFEAAAAMKLADEMFWTGTWAGKPVEGPPAVGLPFGSGG